MCYNEDKKKKYKNIKREKDERLALWKPKRPEGQEARNLGDYKTRSWKNRKQKKN